MLPIASVLDTDLYKLTMQQAVLECYPDVEVEYRFKNRRPTNKFSPAFHNALLDGIHGLADLSVANDEIEFLRGNVPFLKPSYLGYLRNYRFNPSEVAIDLNETTGDLDIVIRGPWHRTILWEVPLMAMISELYFRICDTDWDYDGQELKILDKRNLLYGNQCVWSDFGTRRRRSYQVQDLVVQLMASANRFMGTSNVHFAHKYNVKPIGTMAHEWIMAISVLEGLRHANRFALYKWNEVYKGDLGIALTDTFGTEAFFKDFDSQLARLYDGVRHDSADPFEFIDKVYNHYRSLRIDPTSKTTVFSDSLTTEKAIKLQLACHRKLRPVFGIGTHFTNDFSSPALNMVIKLWSVNGIPVVKLSDDQGKAQGDPDAVRVARWTFFNQAL